MGTLQLWQEMPGKAKQSNHAVKHVVLSHAVSKHVFSSAQLKRNAVFTLYLFLFLITPLKAVHIEKMHRLSSQIEGK